jgi:hypothetical protein
MKRIFISFLLTSLFIVTMHIQCMDSDTNGGTYVAISQTIVNEDTATRNKFTEAGAGWGAAIGFFGGMSSLVWIMPATLTATKSAITNILIGATVGTIDVVGSICLVGALGILIGDGIWHYKSNRNNSVHDVENPETT